MLIEFGRKGTTFLSNNSVFVWFFLNMYQFTKFTKYKVADAIWFGRCIFCTCLSVIIVFLLP